MFRSILTALFLSIALLASGQKEIPPPSNVLVNDFAGLLSQSEASQLESKLRDYALETSTQIAIVADESLEGEDPFDYSYRLAEEWGVGGGEYDNGILIYIAEAERAIRIQTGLGAEGFLTDAMSKRIIDNIITPAFRQGQYYQGLDQATNAIMDMGRGEYSGEGQEKSRDAKGGVPAILVIALLLFIIILFSRMGQDDDDDDGGYYRGGRYGRDPRRKRRGGGWIFLPGPWIGGGGGGGGWGDLGGGGFGGFGGGGFGGGGAGGSW